MDQLKKKQLINLRQSQSDALADRMGLPRIKIAEQHLEFDEAVARGGGKASFIMKLPPVNAAQQRKVIYRLKTRKAVLDDEIELARTKALNPNSAASIFAELVKLAEKQQGSLIGVDDDAIKYQVGVAVKFFTVRHLRARLKRADAR